MARVRKQKASGRARRVCGALGCGREIAKGEEYYTWTPRSMGRQVRCLEHPPKRSDLASGLMSGVYAAIEDAEAQLANDSFETVGDVKATVETVVEVAREVIEQWRAVAEEHFGGGGPNAERADELEGWVDELDNFEPDEPEEPDIEEFDEEAVGQELSQELFGIDDPSDLPEEDRPDWEVALQEKRDEWKKGTGEDGYKEEAIENAKSEANELLGQCPL